MATIKKGTYRFNDVPTNLGYSVTIDMPFITPTEVMPLPDEAVDELNAYIIESGAGYPLIEKGTVLYTDYHFSQFAFFDAGVEGDETTYSTQYYRDSATYTPNHPIIPLLLEGDIGRFVEAYRSFDSVPWADSQIITVLEDVVVEDEVFATWFEANTEPVAVEITYKGEKIELSTGDVATLHIGGKKLTEDLVIKVNGIAVPETPETSECSGNHIIDVDTLPTENIDENAVYKIKQFNDIALIPVGGNLFSLILWSSLLTEDQLVNYYVVSSKPTSNIKISSLAEMHFYYVKNENEIFAYGDLANTGTNSWVSFATILLALNMGEFTMRGEATREDGLITKVPDMDVSTTGAYAVLYDIEKGYYQYDGYEWEHLYEPKLTDRIITSNGEYTPDDNHDGFRSVKVDFDNERLRAIIGRTATELIPSDFYQKLVANNYVYTDIADYAFYKYYALTKVEIGADYKTKYGGKIYIGECAFCDCTNLTSVDFENVANIGDSAFRGTRITKITSSNLYYISSSAFADCSSLASVNLSFSHSTTPLTIWHYAFRDCTALSSVILTSPKLSFGSVVFDGCTNLESITLDTPNVPSIKADTFPSTLKHIYVRADMVESIKAGENWSAYADIVSAIV